MIRVIVDMKGYAFHKTLEKIVDELKQCKNHSMVSYFYVYTRHWLRKTIYGS